MIPKGLYAITNGPRVDLDAVVGAALRGGAGIVQYRDKTCDHERRLAEAGRLAALCRNADVPLIINDDIELALASGADGVHLGLSDGDVATARQRLGSKAIIGATCHDSMPQARAAIAAGASYVAFGAFFASSTKPQARRAPLALLGEARSLGVPVVAIGGIRLDNAAELITAGADCIAVVSALFDSTEVGTVARQFSSLFTLPPRTS